MNSQENIHSLGGSSQRCWNSQNELCLLSYFSSAAWTSASAEISLLPSLLPYSLLFRQMVLLQQHLYHVTALLKTLQLFTFYQRKIFLEANKADSGPSLAPSPSEALAIYSQVFVFVSFVKWDIFTTTVYFEFLLCHNSLWVKWLEQANT